MDHDETVMAVWMLVVISLLLLFGGFAKAQAVTITGPAAGQSLPLTIVGPSVAPTPTPTPASCITISSPAQNAVVAGSVPLQTTDKCPGKWFERLYVDGATAGDFDLGQVVWNTVGTSPGPHVIAVTAQTKNPNSTPAGVAAEMLQVAAPSPTPTPSATPTSTPTPGPATFIPDPLHPDNEVANNTVPTAAWMATFKAAVANGLGPPGCPATEPCEVPGPILQAIDPSYTGTTDQILAHYATVYGIDPDLMRADAMQETTNPPPGWHQGAIGDIGNGISLGILQIKSSDYPPTCPKVAQSQNTADVNDPSCMSHLSTSLATVFRVADMASCIKGGAAAYFAHGRDMALSTGHHPYPIAVANGPSDPDLTNGCLGLWFSGDWESPASLSYQASVMNYYQSKPWLPAALQRRHK